MIKPNTYKRKHFIPLTNVEVLSQDEFLGRARSIQEIALWLDCSERHVRTEIERGELPARRIGKAFIRILPNDLRSWLDRGLTVGLEAK